MAVEFISNALLSAFLDAAFDRLASAEIWDYFRGRKLNEILLKRLNIMLLSINAVADDAEQKQIRNPHVKAWLDAVKDAVFEAEDLLDEIDTQVSQRKLEAESQSSTSKIGELPKGLNPPPPSSNMLYFNGRYLVLAIKTGRVTGILSLTEGIAVGRTFAALKNNQVDGNKEMMTIGLVNIPGSCSSCYVTTGSFFSISWLIMMP